MIAAVKELAAGFARRTARRLVIRAGFVVLSGVAALGYRAATGQELIPSASADSSVAPPTAAASPDAERGVRLQGEPAADAQVAVPDLNAPKRAAQRAADATNASTAAKTGQAVPAPGGPAATGPAPRSGPGSVPAVPATPAATELALNVPAVTREVFTYAADGRRDPFYSLILTEDLRPLLSDLKLVGILYETSGKRSVAIMRDVVTNAQYRVATSQTLGRMRVTQIKPKSVIFSIDEFGLSRQDSLVLTDTTRVRN